MNKTVDFRPPRVQKYVTRVAINMYTTLQKRDVIH